MQSIKSDILLCSFGIYKASDQTNLTLESEDINSAATMPDVWHLTKYIIQAPFILTIRNNRRTFRLLGSLIASGVDFIYTGKCPTLSPAVQVSANLLHLLG